MTSTLSLLEREILCLVRQALYYSENIINWLTLQDLTKDLGTILSASNSKPPSRRVPATRLNAKLANLVVALKSSP